MSSSNRFPGKVAFVSGAASGIGRATAVATEGARVAILDRTEDALRQTADAIRDAGGEVLVIGCDVSIPEQQVKAAVARTVETFGRLDIAFNNAGVENKPTPLHEIELDEWDRILDINLRGTFVCMKHELAQMLKQGGGVVVNTLSGAGIRGVAGGSAYAASKHAIIGMTKSAALDYAKSKIRVNAVLPGNIETPMMDRFTGGDIQKAIDLEPVGRLGKPEEIAEAVLWMSSDLGGFVTSASILSVMLAASANESACEGRG
jgi:NAD(P)-dependent dehydrogenase (short-subunit alcohol dehydrogenase family)